MENNEPELKDFHCTNRNCKAVLGRTDGVRIYVEIDWQKETFDSALLHKMPPDFALAPP